MVPFIPNTVNWGGGGETHRQRQIKLEKLEADVMRWQETDEHRLKGEYTCRAHTEMNACS